MVRQLRNQNKWARISGPVKPLAYFYAYGEGMVVFTWFEYGLSRPVPSTAVVT